MSILKIKNENGEWQGITSVKGEKGDAGVSPDITVYKNDRKTYQLQINTKDRKFTTPNLKPNESAYIGNTDGELGVIDNWFDPEGHRVTAALTELPALPRMASHYPTRYIFDHDVVMYTMDGEPNEKDICSWEDYTRHEGSEITVEPNGQDFLTDYIIYNARPKYEWDTWEEKQLMKKTDGFPDRIANWNPDKDEYVGGNPFKPGQWNWINTVMIENEYLPAVCDVGLYDWGTPNKETGEFTLAPQQMPLDIHKQPLEKYVYWCPEMKSSIWANIMQNADGNCCGEEDQWGISRMLQVSAAEPAAREAHPKEMAVSIVSDGDSSKFRDADGNHIFRDAPKHRGIAVALDPAKFYTIESWNGPVAIFSPCAGFTIHGGEQPNTGRHVTKIKKDLYESRLETITIDRRQETQIVNAQTNGQTGKVPVGSDKVLGTTVSYYVNDNPNYVGRAEVPVLTRCPHKVIEKGESCTFRINSLYQRFSYNYWGVFLFCWNEEDYAGIKITEGIEPYSVMDAERIASGATKFNMKVCFGDENSGFTDPDAPRYEYNIRLCDTTEDNGYVRYLTNEMKKSYDLDEFSLVGHHHEMSDIDDLQELVDTIPIMEVSTTTLSDGASPLEENHYYFVYEGE